MGKKGADNFADRGRARASQSASGFTLTELMAVVVILGIMSALAYPYMGSSRRATAARDFASQLGAGLQRARSRAVAERLAMRAFIYRDRLELRAYVRGSKESDPDTAPTASDPTFRVVLAGSGTDVLNVLTATTPAPSTQILSTSAPVLIDFLPQGQVQFVGQAPLTSAFIFLRNTNLPTGVQNRLFRVDVRALTGHVAVRNGWN